MNIRGGGRRNNVVCKRWHTRAVVGVYMYANTQHCVACIKIRNDARHVTERSPLLALWEDDGSEYRWLREGGFTPQEIGAKYGVNWESFQRTLYRRIGRKADW